MPHASRILRAGALGHLGRLPRDAGRQGVCVCVFIIFYVCVCVFFVGGGSCLLFVHICLFMCFLG